MARLLLCEFRKLRRTRLPLLLGVAAAFFPLFGALSALGGSARPDSVYGSTLGTLTAFGLPFLLPFLTTLFGGAWRGTETQNRDLNASLVSFGYLFRLWDEDLSTSALKIGGGLVLGALAYLAVRVLCPAAVCRARSRGDTITRSEGMSRSFWAVALACSIPVSFKGMSVTPQTMFSRFQAVSPWRVT